jgi:hypothetical protein
MELQIKNREIFFAVENCWNELNYKLKTQINKLVSENSEDNFVQTIDIDAQSFIFIMKAVNSQPQGIAKDINPPMHLALKAQILALVEPVLKQLALITNEEEINHYKAQNADILMMAEKVQSILKENENMLEAKILNGKTQILL